MKRAFRATLALPVALAASCGVGGALAASGGGGGGGGGGSPPPPPPSVVVASPAGQAASNLVAFTYVLRDPQVREDSGRPGGADDPRVRITAQWEDADAPDVWNDMTEAEVRETDGRRGLSLGQHTFVWNTLPDLGGRQGRFRVRVRVVADYEETAGIRRRFRTREVPFTIDARWAGTVFGAQVQPPDDLDTFPVDVRPDGTGFVVADFGANIVERVDSSGLVRRLLGFGVPGDTVDSGKSPGVARLQTLLGVEIDAAGNLYTNHSNSILVTNQGPAPLAYGAISVPPFMVVKGTTDLQDARDVRIHPSGALLCLDQGRFLVAFNRQDPAAGGSTPIVLAGVTIAPGAGETIAGGGVSDVEGVAATAALIDDAVAIAIGPDAEVYFVERNAARVRVVNTGTTDLTIGGSVVAAGTIRTVAGDGNSGFDGDGGPALAARFRIPTAIDVSPERALFIADTANVRVRVANLGTSDFTFAGTTIAPRDVDTVVGGGAGGVGSKARDLQLAIPNGLALDANGHLLVADERQVVFVNGGTTTTSAYGVSARGGYTARVYDASRRGGVPLAEPRAVHAPSATEVYFTDRATVRVMNLDRESRVFGGDSAVAGGTAIVGGGAVPGFGGDGGSARSAAFSFPSGLAAQGRLRLFVADTGNGRIRLVNVGDPRLAAFDTDMYLGQEILPGAVRTVVGGAPGPLPQDGDGLAAASASLRDPLGVAVAPDGLLWILDTGHHRVRVVNPGAAAVVVAGVTVDPGTIRTIVGDGTPGFTADGPGPWKVNEPSAIAIDNAGVVYFADRGNARIRCLNTTAAAVTRAGIVIAPGEVRTLVGTGVAGNSGDGGDGIAAQIDSPRGLFVQSRLDATAVALYFSDESQNVVRVLNLTSDEDLALVIGEDRRVLVTVPASSVFTVAGGPNTVGFPNPPAFAGDGAPASEVRFNAPFGIAVTVTGGVPAHFFVADRRNDRLRRFGAPTLVKTN